MWEWEWVTVGLRQIRGEKGKRWGKEKHGGKSGMEGTA